MNFYQKYRPKKISELDLVSVREALLSTLSSGKVSHAYLFVGPRGAGKTSTARILAQAVNCLSNVGKTDLLGEPCDTCESCRVINSGASVDVIEIDAASNGLVDDIRDLREKVRLSPVQLAKKVYIIDEVHMVSTAGFNALLKTLEEPPEHALFILCTTEAQKVPDTIVSRCAKVSFTKGNLDEVVSSLMKAVTGEDLEVEDSALQEIALATDGSFREGHKLLEQLSSYGKKITDSLVSEVLGIFGRGSVTKLLESVIKKDGKEVMGYFANMEKDGTKANILVISLLNSTRKRMEEAMLNGENVEIYLKIIDSLITASDRIKMSPLPLLPIEVALLSLCTEMGDEGKRKNINEVKINEREVDKIKSENVVKVEAVIPKEISKVEIDYSDRQPPDFISLKDESESNAEVVDCQLASIDKVKMEWNEFLNSMALSNGSLAGMLRQSAPVDLNGKSLTLSVASRFQQDMLERDVKKKIIEDRMAKIWGPITFKCVLAEGPKRTEPLAEDENVSSVIMDSTTVKGVMAAAEEIFGN